MIGKFFKINVFFSYLTMTQRNRAHPPGNVSCRRSLMEQSYISFLVLTYFPMFASLRLTSFLLPLLSNKYLVFLVMFSPLGFIKFFARCG